MERDIQILAVIHFAVIGLSHISAPHAWVEFFIALRNRRERGVFIVALLSLGFGSMILAFHRVWSGIPLILTLIGIGQVIKGGVYLILPRIGMRKLEFVKIERSRGFVYAGCGLVAVATLLGYHLISEA